MFHRVPEQKMHLVKWFFVICWVLLIASLFYDPISQIATERDAWWSFLSLDNPRSLYPISEYEAAGPDGCKEIFTVQGACVDERPYTIGAKIFWGMIIPSAVMLLLVLGHETWRRICPLSFLSQIPRNLGKQRTRKVENPRTGKVRYELVKIDKDSWLGRNHLYFQFIFLCTGLCVRILFINSERVLLGLWFTLTAVAAITVGYLYAGKSWCQYFCPMAPVQAAYNGPRALLGSEAHQGSQQVTTQSMCRTFDKATGKEKSACVSCQSPCIDIDQERRYWEVMDKPGRKLSQYGYVGLVTGFYLYYWFFSGTISYYYSGAWNHEEDQLDQLFRAGFYFFDTAIPIPKIIATPLTIAVFVAGFYFLFSWLEKAYYAFRKRGKNPISQKQSRHVMFSIATFVVFNIYFMFGGRPVVKLMMSETQQLFFNGFVMLVSTLWLYRTLGRSNEAYSRESLANSLRRQLSKLPIDFSKYLEGRSIETLKPDEVYVLAAVLPEFSKESRSQVYKGLLRDQLEQGNITSADSLEALKSIRLELGVKEEEHFAALNELSVETPDLLDPTKQRSRENQLRIASYQQALELQLLDLLEEGVPLQEALHRRHQNIEALEEEYGITSEEKAQLIDQMTNDNSVILRKAEVLLGQLKELAVQNQVLSNFVPDPSAPLYQLLRKVAIEQKQRLVTKQLLGILEVLGPDPEALKIANTFGVLADNVLPQMLQDNDGTKSWPQRLNPKVLALLPTESGDLSAPGSEAALEASPGKTAPRPLSAGHQAQLVQVLTQLLQEREPLVQAASLYGLDKLDAQQGSQYARQLISTASSEYWLVRETAEDIILGQSARSVVAPTLITEVFRGDGQSEQRTLQQGVVQIGRSRINDIVLDAAPIAQQHAILYLDDQGASVIDLGSPGVLHIGDQVVENDRYRLSQGDVIRFSDSEVPSITVYWEMLPVQSETPTEPIGTLEKLLLIYEINLLRSVKPEALIELARKAEIRVYSKGATICKLGDIADELLLLIEGEVGITLPQGETEVEVNTIQSGQTIGEMGVLSRKPRSANVIAKSENNRVLVIEASDFESVLRSDSEVSRSLLMVMIDRLQDLTTKVKS